MSDDEDVPPLEDMSGLIHQIECVRHQMGSGPKSAGVSRAKTEECKNKTTKLHSTNETKSGQSTESTESPAKPQTFGGMKKGFLFSSSSKQKDKPKADPTLEKHVADEMKETIPVLKPKDPDAKHKQYEIPEVQQAMSASQSFLQNKEWVTEDLLHKVESNKTLLHGLTNPHFMQALNEFQANPQQAMQKYASNPEMQGFLTEFCAVLGDHFTKMEPTKPRSSDVGAGDTITVSSGSCADISVHSSTNSKQSTDAEDQRIQEILADQEIREILLDPKVKSLIDMLRSDPNNAQRMLHQSDRELQLKIRKLVDVGLLQFQR